MTDYVLLILMVIISAISQVIIRATASKVNLVDLLDLRGNLRHWGALGVAGIMILIAAFCYLVALQRIELSVAYAFTSLNNVAVAVLAVVVLGEKLSLRNIAALALIVLGVLLVAV